MTETDNAVDVDVFAGEDRRWMREAVALAKRAWGRTSPNPLVGAVIVSGGRIVGRGWHHQAGAPHAEVEALKAAGAAARGATVYVTLEPCSTYGRTPPCVNALLDAGVARVVVGAIDPNPAHAGRGIRALEDGGLETLVGVEKSSCERLNESFIKWITTGKPLVLLKLATTLDGRIATANGVSRWITGVAARRRVQRLRQWADAIMVGGATVRADRPSLTARDRRGQTIKSPRRLVATRSMDTQALAAAMPPGIPPEPISANSPLEWEQVMSRLGAEGVTALLVEGGGGLAAELLAAGVVDRVEFHVAPKILGGAGSRPAVGGTNPDSLAQSLELRDVKVANLGADIQIIGDLRF